MSEPNPHTKEDFAKAMSSLLPRGKGLEAFHLPHTNASKFMKGFAAPFAALEERFLTILKDLNPAFSDETLNLREEEAGLPDECTFGASTLQERKLSLLSKWQAAGGDDVPYFEALAQSLGYDVTIDVWQSAICGLSVCGGEDQCGHEDVDFTWSVTVHGPRITYCRSGESECGDLMAEYALAEDLECRFRKYGPAEATLVFFYEEN